MNKRHRSVIDTLERAATFVRRNGSVDHPLVAELTDAKKLLGAAPRRRTPAERAARKPQSVKVKERQQAEMEKAREAAAAEMHAEVNMRAGGLCELCLCPPRVWDGLVHHHVVSGIGKRKAHEAVENVIAIHDRSCHKLLHNDPLWAFVHMKNWCDRHGYFATWREFERRADKALEARRAARTEKESAR